jgi:hypothetical protein
MSGDACLDICLQCGSKAADAQQVRASNQEGWNSEELPLINQSANAKDTKPSTKRSV